MLAVAQAVSLLLGELPVPLDEVVHPPQAGDCLLDVKARLTLVLLHLLLQRPIPVLDHVFSSIREYLGNPRPPSPVLLHQLQQANVLLDRPLVLFEGGAEVIAPPLPALLGGSHEPCRSKHAVRNQLPVDSGSIFPISADFYLFGEFLYLLFPPGVAVVGEFELEDLEFVSDDFPRLVDEKPAEKALIILALYNRKYT